MKEKKNTFIMPEALIVLFKNEDIIADSIPVGTDPGFDNPDADTY